MSSIVPDRLPGRRRERRWINGWLMTTDHTTSRQREIGALFLEGQGWMRDFWRYTASAC
jgi:hypothetical protein